MTKYWIDFDGTFRIEENCQEYENCIDGLPMYDSPRECIKTELEKFYISKEEIQDKICRLHDLYNILPLDGTRGLSGRK